MSNHNPHVRLIRDKTSHQYRLQVLFNIDKDRLLPFSEEKDIDTQKSMFSIYVQFRFKKQVQESKCIEPVSIEMNIPYSLIKRSIHVTSRFITTTGGLSPEADGETIIHFESAVEE